MMSGASRAEAIASSIDGGRGQRKRVAGTESEEDAPKRKDSKKVNSKFYLLDLVAHKYIKYEQKFQ